MSSTRRAANEINILAMLDRQEGGALPRRFLRGLLNQSRLFWYGVAGVLACALVGSLVWLARDSGASAATDTALAGAVTSAGGRLTGLAAAPPAPAASRSAPDGAADSVADSAFDFASKGAPDAGPESAPIGRATVVNVAPAQPGEPAAPAPAITRQPPARMAAAERVRRKAAPAKAAHAKAAPAKAAPIAVDTDVALISAIIQHANKHQEAEEAACAAPPCGPRASAKP
jgi:hypothetical protein